MKMEHQGIEFENRCIRTEECASFPNRCWNCIHSGFVIANMNLFKPKEDTN